MTHLIGLRVRSLFFPDSTELCALMGVVSNYFTIGKPRSHALSRWIHLEKESEINDMEDIPAPLGTNLFFNYLLRLPYKVFSGNDARKLLSGVSTQQVADMVAGLPIPMYMTVFMIIRIVAYMFMTNTVNQHDIYFMAHLLLPILIEKPEGMDIKEFGELITARFVILADLVRVMPVMEQASLLYFLGVD